MTQQLAWLDWAIIAVYLVGLMAMAVWLARAQGSREDYYVGGRKIGAWPIAISIMATQCSTNSILGAPAFVGFTETGGLVWLQYELALPLAMLFLIVFFVPKLRSLQLVSVYSFLENRFDLQTRLLLSGLFLFVRAFATAVTVYSIALVIDLITGIGFFWAVVVLGAFTVVYDAFGGMRGVVYSDVLQMAVLVGVLLILFYCLVNDAGGAMEMWAAAEAERKQALDFSHHGMGDGYTFAFWPMLFGGLFLYVAYYGCDQSQVQRALSTDSVQQTNKALMLNGLLRFPLVALYCFIGLGLAVYAMQYPEFIADLPSENGVPQYNMVVPLYMLQALPVGLVGLGMVALFAAAMSSLDSVINSLSATTMEDFVRRASKQTWSARQELWLSRGITLFWGVITLWMAFYVGDIAPTVLEAINKIGSLANGPILAVFVAAILLRRIGPTGVKVGFILGITINLLCWRFAPQISWLWWNVIGCGIALACAWAISAAFEKVPVGEPPVLFARPAAVDARYGVILLLWAVVLLVFLAVL